MLAVSSLMTYALSRVNYLVGLVQNAFPPGLTSAEIQSFSLHAYVDYGIYVIDELLAIGAIVCIVALIPATLLRGTGRSDPQAAPETTSTV